MEPPALGRSRFALYKARRWRVRLGAFEKITISVPAEMAAALRQSVEDGHYVTESEIVRDALGDWARTRAAEHAKLDKLRTALVEADKGSWFSEDEAFALVEDTIARHERR